MNTAKRVLSPSKPVNTYAEPKKFKQHIEVASKPATLTAAELDQENLDFLLDDDDFDLCAVAMEAEQQKAPKLDLSTWQRCVVERLERDQKNYSLILHLRADVKSSAAVSDAAATAVCHLQAPWNQMQLKIGDFVSVQAQWHSTLGSYAVDKDYGYCVSDPDTLISGTSIVGSLFCRRKAVLQNRFRDIETGSSVMVIGSLVHELLQMVLAKGLCTIAQIEDALKSQLHSPTLIRILYESNLTFDEVRLEMEKFVQPIAAFVEQYLKGLAPPVLLPNTFQGCISEIQDIEENMWVPQLGLKGKVDVTVRVRNKCPAKAIVNDPPIPLELKTGRATFSMEHRGQLLLYQLMQTTLGTDTKSGLLLYLREGIMREVRSSRNEQRDLIMLRNDLVNYLTREVQLPPIGESLTLSEGKLLHPFVLPEPISHHSACTNCVYATICCSFATTDPHLELAPSHPLQKVMEQKLQHLTQVDYEYVIRWCGLLALEDQESSKSLNQRALWTELPATRQQQRRAVCDLQLVQHGRVIAKDSRFLQTLERAPDVTTDIDFTLSGFELGEYVIISTTKRLAVASGFITKLERSSIELKLERDLYQNYSTSRFIMDKHESQSFSVFNYTNLGLLLNDTPRAQQLRSIFVIQTPPTFCKVLPQSIRTHGRDILVELNSVQRAAALRAITTTSYLLIKGLPGTGKTQTLVAIVRLLHLLGRSILITSQTHSAVDNLLLRLQPHNLPLLRLGSSTRIHPLLQSISEETLTNQCTSREHLKQTLESRSIVGVTCLGSAHALFQHRQFDYCIVDEATQVMQPTVLRPLWHSNRFILVGDPDQLPPLIKSREARQRGADETLFQCLDCDEATAVLTLQYRMNRIITKLANELTYCGALVCGNPTVESATLQLQALPATNAKWLHRALQVHIEQSVVLLDTLNCAERSFAHASRSKQLDATVSAIEQEYDADEKPAQMQQCNRRIHKYTNYCEAAVVFHILHHLLAVGYNVNRIGVIAPYRSQVKLFSKFAMQCGDEKLTQVEFNTVDQYQGRDKDIIIYSCTKTGDARANDAAYESARSRDSEILEDQRRLTVAITRAKHKLIVLGDSKCLERYAPFRELFAHIPSRCRLELQDGRMGFSWQSLLDGLTNLIDP